MLWIDWTFLTGTQSPLIMRRCDCWPPAHTIAARASKYAPCGVVVAMREPTRCTADPFSLGDPRRSFIHTKRNDSIGGAAEQQRCDLPPRPNINCRVIIINIVIRTDDLHLLPRAFENVVHSHTRYEQMAGCNRADFYI